MPGRSLAFMLAGAMAATVSSVALAEDPQPRPAGLHDEAAPVEDYDVGPKATRTAIPEYPRGAYELGVEGTVVLEIVVDVKGRVARARVVKSIPELDAAALACVKKWRFTPARKEGRPVAALAAATITFRRADKPAKAAEA